MKQKEFFHKVYQIVIDIPPGRVATYGMIAFLTGQPQRSRMVGQALHHAPRFSPYSLPSCRELPRSLNSRLGRPKATTLR